jgi:hypothetical protein
MLRELGSMIELGCYQCAYCSWADAVESNFLDAVRHILEALYLGLPTHVHYFGDCVDGRREGVKLLLEPYDRQKDLLAKLVDQLKKM